MREPLLPRDANGPMKSLMVSHISLILL